ncbi:MAG: phytanoyl-CoA dioxygenase family protein [Deltaproteobacteria bacterium]|nr:phytanoyl-CoA dioxygenase family protein [Deltaproteobacteria bacterium]
MPDTDLPPLTQPSDDALAAALAHYEEHGFARLGRMVPDATLEALRARLDAIMLGEVRWPGLFYQHDGATGRYEDAPIGLGWQGPSLAYRKIEKLELDPLFRAFLDDRAFERVVRARISGDVVIYRAIAMNKAASGGSDLPWHQDGGTFWGLDRDPDLQVWTALDDAPEDGGCLEIVPGTHRGGLATRLGGVIPDDLVRAEDAEARKVLVPARAGEVVLIHNYVWHRSGRTLTGRARRAISVCYMSAATRCLRKKRAPRTFFPVFRR